MIKLKNVNKNYNSVSVLVDINLEIKKGEAVVINGVSGSGKSTLLSIVGSLLKPTSGLVEVDGLNIVSLNDLHLSNFRATKVGFVTQSFYLFENLNVRDNIVIPLVLNKLSQELVEKKLDISMRLASIEHKSSQVVSTLSGGEKQRCVIARALVNDPEIVLCDEPTANLDKQNSLKFANIMKELKNRGKTIIIATHDPLISELEWIDKVININEGKIE